MSKSLNIESISSLQPMIFIRIIVLCTLIFGQRSLQAQYSSESILADGDIYKLSTTQDGVYRMDYSFLKNQLGVDIDNVDPRTIKLYGNGGKMLSEEIDDFRIDDLVENHIVVVGEADGRFDANDYILFYGQSPNQRIWDMISNQYSAPKNIYTTEVHYFLKTETASTGLRRGGSNPLIRT